MAVRPSSGRSGYSARYYLYLTTLTIIFTSGFFATLVFFNAKTVVNKASIPSTAAAVSFGHFFEPKKRSSYVAKLKQNNLPTVDRWSTSRAVSTVGLLDSTTVVLTTTNAGLLEITENVGLPVNSTTVLTSTNAGFLDITENMLESAKRTGACHNITIIAEDEQSYKALSERAKTQPGLSIRKTNSGETTMEALKLNSKLYNQLVNKRPAYVLSFLEKGNRVLFVDVDTYWFRDPLKDVDWDFDIALHNEFDEPRRWFCDGFVYYSPTNKTINLVKEWAHLLATTEKKTPDQRVLNKLISSKKIPELKVKTLKASQFPDGQKYFQTKGWKEKNNDTIVVHLSYILGHDAKVKALKNQGFWVI